MKKNCSRCGDEVLCAVQLESICTEEEIDLLPASIKFLRKTTYQCLCLECLSHINKLLGESRKEEDVEELQEEKHYYMEGGYLVFTEYFHMIRGCCCKSNCRHCAYGFNPKNLVKRVK